ncbi:MULTISPECIES: TetR/AcrR family transcriptional regulator [unclassified Cupriavidus]|uniref:TetR/AcrR family transcriptional regulator n=1 Tax=unclassified Cupriavidus TaxID=2640874 RepID=UPI0010566AD1|nr:MULTISPECIES: TetR/AcrR family transcriptional regulator [unclassified Cupriavidus]MBF6989035.1 TetR/AcrR family transcriptional regulator [Cupriavidus sp. IK-TO18]TDF65057.1 TetR/AcrR family transcriptional regulator [Cupriavidus sp. L7L]
MTPANNLETPDSRDSATAKAETNTRRRRPGPKVGDHEARRASFLAAATAVVAREGYAGASLRKVAEEAGCTTGSLLHYFENKEAMIKALVESHFDKFESFMAPVHDPTDIKATFKRFVTWTNAEDPGQWWLVQFQLLAQAKCDPALAAVFQRRNSQYRSKRVALLEKGQEEGLVRSDVPAELLADQLSAMGDGWMMMLPIEPERFTPSRIDALLDAVITVISPPGPPPGKTDPMKPAVRTRRPKKKVT